MPHNQGRKLRVLVGEDEFLLAALLEENLLEQGYEVVGPFPELNALRAGVEAEEFHIAVLDVNMNGERVYPVALRLMERRLPFILLTGYGVASLPAELRGVPIMAKPYSFPALESEIQRLVALHRVAAI